jgi:hypothetical protein
MDAVVPTVVQKRGIADIAAEDLSEYVGITYLLVVRDPSYDLVAFYRACLIACGAAPGGIDAWGYR